MSPTRIWYRAALVAILLKSGEFSWLWAAGGTEIVAPSQAPTPSSRDDSSSKLYVIAGSATFDGMQVYVGGFTIDRVVTPSDTYPRTCEPPTVEEWLVAAKDKRFKIEHLYEFVKQPPHELCRVTEKDLAGTLLLGAHYFAGLGLQPGPHLSVIRGGTDARSTISRISADAFAATEEGKPGPRGYRCVRRSSLPERGNRTIASVLHLREGPGTEFRAILKIPINTEVTLWHRVEDWAWIEVPTKGEVAECTRFGWAASRYIEARELDPDKLLALGKTLLEHGDANLAVPTLERAAALRPRHRPTLDVLLKAYQKLENQEKAAELKKRMGKSK